MRFGKDFTKEDDSLPFAMSFQLFYEVFSAVKMPVFMLQE